MLTVCKGYVAIAVATSYAVAACCLAGLLLLANLTGSSMLAACRPHFAHRVTELTSVVNHAAFNHADVDNLAWSAW